MKQIFIFNLLVVTLLSGCKEKELSQNLKDYYYPLDNLGSGKVYEYHCEDPAQPPYYKYFIAVKDSSENRYLISSFYKADFSQANVIREMIIPTGAWMQEMRFFKTDSLGKVTKTENAVIETGTLYPWEAKEDSTLAYRFKIKFKNPSDTSVSNVLLRDRYFKGFHFLKIEDKEYPCAKFAVKEYSEVSDNRKGGLWKYELQHVEWYAEKIGLVRMETTDGKQKTVYNLTKIMSMEDFVKMAGK